MDRFGAFTDEISLTPIGGDGELWRVNDPIAWHCDYKGSDFHVLINQGFVYDLASVPFLARAIVPHTIAPASSALHDKGYRHNRVHVVRHWDGDVPVYHPIPVTLSRADWDNQYYLAMLSLKVTEFRANAAYAGVRAGGWKAWKTHRKNDKRS